MGITGKIYGINGPVITIQGNPGYKMNEMVYVGEHRLVGEVIRLSKEKTTIQIYEETSGLKPGEEVAGAGCAISVKLAPGILNNIFDGIERSEGTRLGTSIESGTTVFAVKDVVSLPEDKLPVLKAKDGYTDAKWPEEATQPITADRKSVV